MWNDGEADGPRKMNSTFAWFVAGVVLFAIIIFIILFPPIQVDNFNICVNEVVPGCETFDRTMERTLRGYGKTVQTLTIGDKETHYVRRILPSNQRRLCFVIASKDARVEVADKRITDLVRQTPHRNTFVAAIESTTSITEIRAITTSNIVPRIQLAFD